MLLRLGSEGNSVATIQEWLNFLGYRNKTPDGKFEPLKVDGKFGKKTENAIMDFQKSHNLYMDGIVGSNTMAALQKAYSTRVVEISTPGVDFTDGYPDRHTLERVYCDNYEGGYTRMSLRNDVADAYNDARKEIIEKGAIITSSGSMRSLHATVSASRSSASFHYTGMAFDLFIYSGMVNPQKDPYVLQLDGERHFKVWARCSDKWKFNEHDKPASVKIPPLKKLDKIVTYNERDPKKNKPVEGHFLNITDIFKRHGFERIGARRRFFEGSSMMGAEWWHFQYTKGLVEKVSTFGNELLKIYSEETLEGTPPWNERNRVYKINWF